MSLSTRALMMSVVLALSALTSLGPIQATEPAEATAHDPHFQDKMLWPADVEKTAYFKETWPKATLMVWARTEKSGAPVDPKDPANWLVDGKPATNAPNANTDVYFPEGSFLRVRDKAPLGKVRHLTVGRGVRVPKSVAIRPTGNVWIRERGMVAEVGAFSGEKDVFLRNDNKDFTKEEAALANKIVFNKAKDASVEIVGVVKAHDELSVLCGTLIVGPDAELVPGNRSVQAVYPDGKLILMSRSKFYKRGNQTWDNDIVVAGELLAGTPQRPLTEDCTLALSWKRQGRGTAQPHAAGRPDDHGLVVRPEGKMRVHSADPAKARLVVTWNGLKSDESGTPEDLVKPGITDLDAIPRKVSVVLQGDVSLDGVTFDHVLKGGIKMPDPSIRGAWNMVFGAHNEGKPDELFSVLQGKLTPKLEVGAADVPRPYSQQTEDEKSKSQDYYK